MTWEWLLQPAITLLALLGLIGVNVAIWIFAFGKNRGRTNTRLDTIEEKFENPQVLPDCVVVFTDIAEKLSALDGKMEVILLFITKSKKSD